MSRRQTGKLATLHFAPTAWLWKIYAAKALPNMFI